MEEKQKVKDMYCENYFCMSVSQHIYFRRRLCNCYFAERKICGSLSLDRRR